MNWRPLVLASVLAACGANPHMTTAAAARSLEDVTVRPVPVLGLSFPGNNPKFYKALSQAGLGVARLSVSWEHREPKPGHYDWSAMDQRIVGLQKLGIEPFLTFESNAKWAVRKETSMLTNGTPKDIGQWTQFVRRAVERYDGDGSNDAPGLMRPVRMYQVANEWEGPNNTAGGWRGTTRELIEFINATHDAIKAQYPAAIVVLGGMTSGNLDGLAVNKGFADFDIIKRAGPNAPLRVVPKERFMGPKAEEILKKRIEPVLLKSHYDVLDLHLYGPPDHDPARIKAVKSIVGDRPMLSAECGGPSMNYHERYVPADHFMAVVSRNLIDLSEGLRFCLWFRLASAKTGATFGNSETALFDRNRKPKPGYRAYILLAALLADVERVERRGDAHIFVIHRKGKPPVLVAWASENDKQKVVKLPKNAAGQILSISDPVRGTYEVSDIPETRTIKLGKWPVVAGKLPADLLGGR